MYDAIIVGGGAAGLAAACALAQRGLRAAVLEKQPRVGRKLLSTGNGRCNLTHMGATDADYHGARAAAARALELCPPDEVRAFFDGLGLPTVAGEEGRVYPMSNQAASVLDALRFAAAERGCEIVTECAVEDIQPQRGAFSVRASDGRTFASNAVLVCTGGLAAPKLGACGDGYRLLERLGHSSAPKLPAIAALKVPPERVRGLKGQRAECEIELRADGRRVRRERGEVIFGEDTVSGIAAMQLARAAGEALRAKRRCEVSLRIWDDGAAQIRIRRERLPLRSMEDFLNGVVAKRVGMALVKAAGIEPLSREARSLTDEETARLGALVEDWTLPVVGVQGFDQAQVTAGGVLLDGFDFDTMESKRVRGLYAAGELLDVDGDCGGYNLQWAWSSGLIAARAIIRSFEGREKR